MPSNWRCPSWMIAGARSISLSSYIYKEQLILLLHAMMIQLILWWTLRIDKEKRIKNTVQLLTTDLLWEWVSLYMYINEAWMDMKYVWLLWYWRDLPVIQCRWMYECHRSIYLDVISIVYCNGTSVLCVVCLVEWLLAQMCRDSFTTNKVAFLCPSIAIDLLCKRYSTTLICKIFEFFCWVMNTENDNDGW